MANNEALTQKIFNRLTEAIAQNLQLEVALDAAKAEFEEYKHNQTTAVLAEVNSLKSRIAELEAENEQLKADAELPKPAPAEQKKK